MAKMNKKLSMIDTLLESVTPAWGRFRLKMNTKLASGSFQFENAFTRDLERMAAEGKIKYDKLSRVVSELTADTGGKFKLTDDDFKILMRSFNFRKAMIGSFNELNIDVTNPIHVRNLTGNFRRIYDLYIGVPPTKVIQGGGVVIPVNWSRKIQKGLSDFTRNYFSSFQKLIKIYNSSMEEYMVLEKQLEDEIQTALGKVTASDGIGPEVKKINALILRIRDFNNKHPRMFWDKAKIELNLTDEGKLLVKTVEESKYFTVFRDRFAKISPESTKLPSNTYSRWDGIKKLFTPNVALRQKTFWKGVYEWFASIPKWRPADSRVLNLLTTLDARTFSELQFNATVRGNKLSAQSYISYKLIQIYVILPVLMDFFESLFDSLILNYKYTDEELREIFPEGGNEEKANVILTMMEYHLNETYGKDFGNLIWEWSPVLSYLLSDVNTEVGRNRIGDELRRRAENERNEFRGWLGETKRNVKAFGTWMRSFWDDDVIDSNSTPTPSPTPTATAVPTTNTELLPTPPTDLNVVSEEMTNAEVDAFIDANLVEWKDLIVKPYKVNTDKTVTLYLSGQDSPFSILFKAEGKVTIKNSN
jgi:hypothetical protein